MYHMEQSYPIIKLTLLKQPPMNMHMKMTSKFQQSPSSKIIYKV